VAAKSATEHNTTMNRCFLVKGWLLISVALAAREATYTSRSSSQRIALVLRTPVPQSSFHMQAEKRRPSRPRQIDELIDSSKIALGLANSKGRHLTPKGHSPHSYGQYLSGKSGKGKSGKEKGASKSKKSKKKEKKEKKEKKHDHDLPSVCEKLDFLSYYPDVSSDDYSGKAGKGKGSRRRELQFEGPGCDMNVFDVAKEIPSLSTFVSLIEAAYLEDLFLCAGPFSVLAPTDRAFEANPSLLDSLLEITNVEELREVLLYHILPGLYLHQDFDEGELSTLQGESVAISVSPLSIDGSFVDSADILACNGALHTIDQVLLPRSKQKSPDCCLFSHC
jgi:uncharacterized surface protein with fasciclin (FAS1) repeats